MTVVSRETRTRWLVVTAVVAALLATPIALAHRWVHAPGVALDTLAARIAASGSQPYQGYAVSTGGANLPTLPDLASVIGLLDGDTSLRVWYAAPKRWRIDTITTDGERDLYQAPTGQSIWDSGTEQLITITGATPVHLPRGPDLNPPDLARRLLAASSTPDDTQGQAPSQAPDDAQGQAPSRAPSDPTAAPAATRRALPDRRIAGLAAAGIRITPTDPDTTIGRIDIWADPASGLPLQVEITTRGASAPVLVSRFLQVSLTAPDAAVTAVPTVPPGAGSTVITDRDVTDELTSVSGGRLPPTLDGQVRVDAGTVPAIAAYGTGLRQFIAVVLPGSIAVDWYRAAVDSGAAVTEILPIGFVSVNAAAPGGFTVITVANISIATIAAPLLTVVIVVDYRRGVGFVFAGAVTPAALTRAANDLAAALNRGRR